jgi:hypothetical protein
LAKGRKKWLKRGECGEKVKNSGEKVKNSGEKINSYVDCSL